MAGSARLAAARALLRVMEGGYSNLVLEGTLGAAGLSFQDRAFAGTLVFGTLERQITLDYQLDRFLKRPVARLDAEVAVCLRLAAYQIFYLDGVPARAAVDESVKLCRRLGKHSAAGLVNGVLRSLLREGAVLRYPDRQTDPDGYDAVRLSCDRSIVALLRQAYDGRGMGMLERAFDKPPRYLRVNTLRTTADRLVARLAEEGVEAACHPRVPDCLIARGGDLRQTASFREGLFHAQDVSAQLAADALDPQPGERIVDVCAAPGGKSFTLAERMGDRGRIDAFDRYPSRLEAVAGGAARLGIAAVVPAAVDGTVGEPSLLGQADRVLCDVPCSGLGTLRRKPDIRFKNVHDFAGLLPLQYGILKTAARYLKPGGTLLYSTCTLHPEENEAIVDRFLREHAGFQPRPLGGIVGRALPQAGWRTILTDEDFGGDGFFLAAMMRTA